MKTEKLMLGTVQMGVPYGINNKDGKISFEESIKILEEAYKCGIRSLDSAEAYGSAHEVIGSFHSGFSEIQFKVITKISAQSDMRSLEGKVKNYLNALRVDRLEALMFHSFTTYRENPDLAEVIQKLKAKGWINYFGVSIYTNEELEYLIDDESVNLIQLPFNLLDNASGRGDNLKLAKEKGKIIHARSAFLQGLFFMNTDSGHPVAEKLKIPLEKIHELAKNQGISVAALALGYCLRQPFIDKVLIGVDSCEQLKENIKASQIELSQELVDAVDNIQIHNRELLNPSLWN